ncbi:carboxypeptidase-like regulatory domain-containing protein, partial [Capnocytophaga leadbetteri]|uniref:carboxypeptidase-like regulatory domain-containing protein n=1 Tax=Capnocytophaga leadbetteri TaxID=327575 RepID=UPI0028E4332B
MICSSSSFAQTTEIKVIDAENGGNIEFATVQWKCIGDLTYKNGTTTDREGVVKLTTPTPQTLVLRVSYVGYQTINDTITTDGKRHTLKLHPESTELADVVVVGKTKAQILRESPEAVSVINAKELQG